MLQSDLITVIAKALGLSLGVLIALLAFRAYRRTSSVALRRMAIGFAILSIATLFGGLIDPFLGIDMSVGLQIQNGLTAMGFLVLAYSIYARVPAIVDV